MTTKNRKYNEFSIRIPPGIDTILEEIGDEFGFKKNDFCNHAIVFYLHSMGYMAKGNWEKKHD